MSVLYNLENALHDAATEKEDMVVFAVLDNDTIQCTYDVCSVAAWEVLIAHEENAHYICTVQQKFEK